MFICVRVQDKLNLCSIERGGQCLSIFEIKRLSGSPNLLILSYKFSDNSSNGVCLDFYFISLIVLNLHCIILSYY